MKVDFTLNGKAVSVDVAPDMPLLWVLRDALNMKGTKFGCGEGVCGACTVHLRGGAAVTTIEGLSPNGNHPLQVAWKELDVPECGYCQAGQIMAAAALLNTNDKPSDSDIDSAMNGNICRCGTYMRIREGIRRAAKITAPSSGQ